MDSSDAMSAMLKAEKAFKANEKDDAKKMVLDVMNNYFNYFNAWWITETNEEYRLASKEFLVFVGDIMVNRIRETL